MKKVLLIILVLVVLGGGAYWWFVLSPEPPVVEDVDPIPENPFPFSTTTPIGNIDTASTTADTTSTEPLPQLYQITTEPVAGFTLFLEEDTGEYVRFMTKNTGHVFETQPGSRILSRLSNTTIPGAVHTYFVNNGSALLAQYINGGVVQTLYGELLPSSIEEESEPYELIGNFISERIKSITVSPDTESIFYLSEDTTGALGIISKPDGSSPRTIFTSLLKDWNAEWVSPSTISVTTKPAANTPGIHRLINTRTGVERNILGTIYGLTTLVNSDASNMIYSKSELLAEIVVYAYNLTTQENPLLSIETLPEKCVWSTMKDTVLYCGIPATLPQAGYPDAWYRGVISFSDSIWRIDVETGTTNRIYSPENTDGIAIDLIKPALSEDEDYLLFINKKDSTLWSLRI